MLHQMERESTDDDPDISNDKLSCVSGSQPTTNNISEYEFSCHCCYYILVNPTTLTCGHNFCRHCLALWWESSHKNECPECRERWEGFPKINILLRDATDKLFSEVVQQRRAEIQANSKVSRSLLAFQRYGDNLGRSRTSKHRGAGFFFSGVLTALTCVIVMGLVYHWGSGVVEQHDLLISKPVSHWTPEEVVSWLEHLGPWTELYREPIKQENVNGRLLVMLGNEELLKSPYSIENQAHRRAILAELDRIKTLGVKPPQNLWEYKAANAGKSLFLLYALKRSPRLTIFYLYLFDYSETFLPFLHTCCPAVTHVDKSESRHLITQLQPSWQQWTEFLVKYCVLPYQLIAEFAWDWLSVHYWTSRFIIVNAMLLSVLEGCALWRLWTTARFRTLPQKMWNHLWKMLSQGFVFVLLWPFVPQFVCSCLFYWALYFSPIINIDLVVQQLMHPETQVGNGTTSFYQLLHQRGPILQRQPVIGETVKTWCNDAEDALRWCFQTADWSVLCGPHGEDINSLTECVTDYMYSCVDGTIPARSAVQVFASDSRERLYPLLSEAFSRTASQVWDREYVPSSWFMVFGVRFLISMASLIQRWYLLLEQLNSL